jgi:hypothetical protein
VVSANEKKEKRSNFFMATSFSEPGVENFLNYGTFPSFFLFFFSHREPPTHQHHRHRGRGLHVNVGAATTHAGNWMGEEDISGLTSVEFEILVSTFHFHLHERGSLPPSKNR